LIIMGMGMTTASAFIHHHSIGKRRCRPSFENHALAPKAFSDDQKPKKQIVIIGAPNRCWTQAQMVSDTFEVPMANTHGELIGRQWVFAAGSLAYVPSEFTVAIVMGNNDEKYTEFEDSVDAEVIYVSSDCPEEETSRIVKSSLYALFDMEEGEQGEEFASTPTVKTEINDASRFSSTLESVLPSSPKISDDALIGALDDREKGGVFGAFELDGSIASSLERRGIRAPTRIQEASAAEILSGKNVILHAETGAGKTLAFLIPALQSLVKKSGDLFKAPPASIVVVAPTHELSLQLFREVLFLLSGGDTATSGALQIAQLISSNADPSPQMGRERNTESIRGGRERRHKTHTSAELSTVTAPIVVGTAKQVAGVFCGASQSMKIECLVMDEVDRLMAVPSKYATVAEQERHSRHPRPALQLLEWASAGNPSLQCIACSATVGRPLRRELSRVLSPQAMKDGLTIVRAEKKTNSESDSAGNTRAVGIPGLITHQFIPCQTGDMDSKFEALVLALTLADHVAPLVFIPDGTSVDFAVSLLQRSGFPAAMPLHAAISNEFVTPITAAKQHRRVQGDNADSTPRILVACKSSARGLHFDGVDFVYILARPSGPDEYLHLAGRTGRCGEAGTVVTILTYNEAAALKAWAKQLDFAVNEVKTIQSDFSELELGMTPTPDNYGKQPV